MAVVSGPCYGVAELAIPGTALGQMQRESAGLSSGADGQGGGAPAQGLDDHDLTNQIHSGRPEGQVMGDDLDGQLGGIWQGNFLRGEG